MKKVDTTKIVVHGTEWVSRMAVLNVSWLLFSLPVLTVVPATDTAFELLNCWEEEGPTQSVFRLFAQTFKKNFTRSYKFGLPMLVIAIIFILDILFLSSQSIPEAGFQVLKYAVYTLFVVFVVGLLYGYPLLKKIQKNTLQTFLMGIMLAVAHPIISLGLLISLIGLFFIFLKWPAVIFFFSFSAPAWLGTKAVSLALEKNRKKHRR
ncbi:YesL family protein [Atopococcus tabaci]|uniref:YesL family protein n=1 Tax=Atopococcus tabaci TaxID=269774 RepID=UPI0003FA98AB|nr:DUF624 domain-containing protein [Atopococcus tabaci]